MNIGFVLDVGRSYWIVGYRIIYQKDMGQYWAFVSYWQTFENDISGNIVHSGLYLEQWVKWSFTCGIIFIYLFNDNVASLQSSDSYKLVPEWPTKSTIHWRYSTTISSSIGTWFTTPSCMFNPTSSSWVNKNISNLT